MTIPEFTPINAIGKIDCVCNIDFKMNAEIEITPKHVRLTCKNCGRFFFYRRVNNTSIHSFIS